MKVAIHRSWSRAARRVAIAVALLVAVALLTQACSVYHVRRAREHRQSLGNLLYVEAAGAAAGPALVFLPGMTGTTTYWREARALELAVEHRRVLLIDELGFGQSPWPDGEYTLDDHLAAIERTLTARGARKQNTLVGHSFGALLAAEYAARHPDEVERVFLFGTPLYRSPEEARRRVGEMSALAGITARHVTLARLICVVHTALLPAAVRIAPRLRRDLPRSVAADGALHFWPSVRGSVENVVLRHSIEPALATLGGKVTFVHGRKDAITPLERVREVAAATGASLVVTGDDHASYWRGAEALLRQRLEANGGPTPWLPDTCRAHAVPSLDGATAPTGGGTP